MTIGERIRHYRQRCGLSQVVCANLVGRSESWLSQVERGLIQLDSISVLLCIARVLKVDLSKLLGPALELPPSGGDHHDEPRGVPALRRVILRPATLTRIAPADGPVELDDLASRVERARLAYWDGCYTELALVLPDLITAARLATQDSADPRRAWGLLTRCYHLSESLLQLVGERDLACLAVDRGAEAAERADDEQLIAVSAWLLGYTLGMAGYVDEADAVIADAVSLLRVGGNGAGPERVAVFGALRLSTSNVAVVAGDVAASRRALNEAARVAELLPDKYVDPWTAFCPTNVAYNDLRNWVEAGDPVEALRVVDRTDLDALPCPHRQAGGWIRAAQAHGLRRNDGLAVASLLEAERIAPEEVRYKPAVHDMVEVFLRRERKSATPGLRGLARRIGVE